MRSRRVLFGVAVSLLAWTMPDRAVAQVAPPAAPETPPATQAPIEPGLPSSNVTPLGPFISPPATPFQVPALQLPSLRSVYGQAEGQRAGLVLTPSLTVNEEYNDNIFYNNQNKHADFITAISPGLSLSYERPSYRVLAAASITSLIYADRTELNSPTGRELFSLDAFYQVNPNVTVTLGDAYLRSENPSTASAIAIATPGLIKSTSNLLTPGVVWTLSPLTTLRVSATWVNQSYGSAVGGTGSKLNNADTYRLDTLVTRLITPRLTATVGYQFAYFDIQGQPITETHTPRVGATYQITQELSGTVSGGPQVVVQSGNITVVPAVSADLTNQFKWGYANVNYTRTTLPSSGLAGTAETTSVGGIVQFTTLARGLVFGGGPRYTTTQSTQSTGTNLDVKTLNVSLQGSWSLTPWLAVVGGYNFLQQRSGGSQLALDVDQNRIFFGVQLGSPLGFQ